MQAPTRCAGRRIHIGHSKAGAGRESRRPLPRGRRSAGLRRLGQISTLLAYTDGQRTRSVGTARGLMRFGNEGAIEDFYENSGGLLFDIAPRLNATVAFLEHRYYGSSLPFGNASYESGNLRFLTIEQALAAKAKVFLGSSTSTFSKQIHLERKVLGYSWDDESCVSLLADGTLTKMCNYAKPASGGKCESW